MTAVDAVAVTTDTFAQLERAWNLADGPGFGEPFADDADFVDIRGEHHRGRGVVAAGHQAIFDSVYAGSTVEYRVESAREVTPGCVLAVVGATLDTPAGPAAGVSHARVTAVLTARDAVWSVAAFHNGLVQVHA